MLTLRLSGFVHSRGKNASAGLSRSKVNSSRASRIRPMSTRAGEPWEIMPPGPNESSKEVFAQVQKSMLLVNDSRLKALEELKGARRRILELEAELEQTKSELTQAKATAEASVGMAAPQAQPQEKAYEASPPDAEQSQPTKRPQTITILYSSGWKQVYVHCNVDNCGWTKAPGIRMNSDGNNNWRLELPGTHAEFVVNNGGDDWDKPNPYKDNGPKNYTVSSSGTYRLASGKLQQQ